jgi:uncharacterized protein (TIGR03067 family)
MDRADCTSQLSESERDLARLQGTWEQVALEVDGVPDAPDTIGAPGALTTFAGQQFTVRTVEGALMLSGSFTLDASTTPRSITWVDAIGPDTGKPLPAIYLLERDRFVFIAGDAGAPRPDTFRTVTGQTMRTFVRRA